MTIQSAITALETLLGDALSVSKSDLEIHGQSEAHFDAITPDAVAYPAHTQDVSEIVKICAAHACPIIPWGTGTSLEGHALPVRGGVTIDLSRMDKVLEINDSDMDVRVQPGVTRKALNTELRATGLFFPVDPGADASLGGMAATRASGTTAVRYGTMRDNVLALEVVLADGRIIRTGTRARKSSAGYDLTGLFVGSEGTLGIITELTLRLQGQPQAIGAAVCPFESVEGAINTVIETIQMGVPMARIEFMDSHTTAAVNAYSNMNFPVQPHLLVEFVGSDAGIADDAETFKEIAAEHGGGTVEWATKTEDRERLWRMRHQAYYATIASRKGARGYVTDVCVPISRLADALLETEADIQASGIPGPLIGHVGDGNFHSSLLIDPSNPEELKIAKGLAKRMAERALAMGGTVTGEHGVGMGKLDYMSAEHGEAWQIMGDIKRTLDPTNIMNPGKMVQQN